MEFFITTAVARAIHQKICSQPAATYLRDPLPGERQNVVLSLGLPGWELTFCEFPDEDNWKSWNSLAVLSKDIYLQPSFLRVLVEEPPRDIQTSLAFIREKGQLIAGLVIQIFSFQPSMQLGNRETDASVVHRSLVSVRRKVSSCLDCQVLVGGQMMATGNHGLLSSKEIPTAILGNALEGIAAYLSGQGQRISIIIAKELEETGGNWESTSFAALSTFPTMVLQLKTQWGQFDDYLADMNSKYRVRAKRARKKMDSIYRRNLSLAEIQQQETRLLALFEQVVEESDFSPVRLRPSFFSKMKQQLGEQYQLWAYYDGENMIGFSTALVYNTKMDAHYLGLDKRYNVSHQLYINILYDLVDYGIRQGFREVDYARTAMEIKSSVGAIPVELSVSYRFRQAGMHRLAPLLIQWLSPQKTWVQRHPFDKHG
jgi:Peptidogalycan biosysnthesis/recognition